MHRNIGNMSPAMQGTPLYRRVPIYHNGASSMYGSGAIPPKNRGNGAVPQMYSGLPVYGNFQAPPPAVYGGMYPMHSWYLPGSHYGALYGNGRVFPPIYKNGRIVPTIYGNNRRSSKKYGGIWPEANYRNGGGLLPRGNGATMVDGEYVYDGVLRNMVGGSYLHDSTSVPYDDLGGNVPPEQSGAPYVMPGSRGDHCGGKLLCKVGEYTCLESCTCIPAFWRCDGEPDCEGAEDEIECGDELEAEVDECNTNNGDVRCPRTGRCIREDWLCDGKDDCGDFSDETRCGK